MKFIGRFLPKKMFWRYMLVFILVGIIPFIVVTNLTLNNMSSAIRQETESRITHMLHLAGVSLDMHFRALSGMTEKMYLYRTFENGTSSNLEQILKSGTNTKDNMNNYLSSLAESSTSLRNVLFIDRVNHTVYGIGNPATKSIRTNWDYDSWDLIEYASQHPRDLVISSPHLDSYFVYGSQSVFTFCRAMLSLDDLPEKETILGFLLLDIDQSIFREAFQAYNWQEVGTLYVLGQDNLILYSSKAEEIGETLQGSDPAAGPVITQDISTCGWQIVCQLNSALVMAPVTQLRNRLFFISMLTLAGMLLLTWLSSRHMAMPVGRILHQMDQVKSGNLNVHVPVDGNDEMSDLSRGFNHMTDALRTHIEQSYVASIRQKEAELDALRMQIHPHFLYNTLEVIRMSSVAHQDMETAQMTLSLVHQLQYVIGESNERVSLQKELDIIEDYISLVSLRYGQIDLKTSVPPDLLPCPILKMTLQPIVENAVQHGLRPQCGGQISISVAHSDTVLTITVMDNGCGMDPDQLFALRRQLESDKMPEVKEDGLRSIGTKNVHDRIRLACGPAYGLEIESQVGIGTAVVLHLPYLPPESSESNPHI
ncbi:MAG: histidine kinase [Clostridia bacterium]|nr:histidine kinase [Clostridia bacterium]